MNLPFRGRHAITVSTVSAVLMACIGHASAADAAITVTTHRLIVGDFNGDSRGDVLS